MDLNTKPRPESKLKLLPEDRQSEIAEFALGHTLADTVVWLATSGIELSTCALSKFLAWYRLKQQMAKNELIVKELLTTLAEQNPDLTPDRIAELGQIFFSSLALEKQDPKAWYLAQQIVLRKAQFQLAFQKYHDQVQARKEAIQRELDAAKSNGGLSPETIQKIENELNLF
jgi:hypothetical protein